MFLKNNFKILIFVSIFLFVGGNVFAGTFGYEGGGFTAPAFNLDDEITGSLFYLSEKAEIQSISAYLNYNGNASTTAGIYDNAGDLVATTTIEIHTGGASGDALVSYTFADENPILEIGNYWLVVWGNTPAVYCYTETGTDLETYQKSSVFTGTLPSTFTSPIYRDPKNSAIYATYTGIRDPVYITIPADFTTSTLAYAGQLFTDLNLISVLAVGLPLGFWVIKKIISLVRVR